MNRLKLCGAITSLLLLCWWPLASNALVIGANYGAGWNLDAKNAFFFAENTSANQLPTRYEGETIVIDTSWQALLNNDGTPNTNTLGFSSLTFPFYWWANFGSTWSGYQPGTWYPSALANHLHGSDISSASEMSITFNSNYPNWYFGTDGNTGGKVDFPWVAMHEITHGLGFYNLLDQNGGYTLFDSLGNPIDTPLPSISDRFLAADNGHGEIQALTDMTQEERTLAVVSGEVYWEGESGTAANGGNAPLIYAPSSFSAGSSLSHLDQSTFPDTLMRPFYYNASGAATPTHFLSATELGMLRDIGWIPEPSSLILFLSGLAILIVVLTHPNTRYPVHA